MTINALQLEYFQCYEDAIIEFHPKFNVIIGTSDKGKSSIIRAIKWAIENQPNSDWLSSFADKGKACSSAIEFQEETYVLRRKKGVKNTYSYADEVGEEHDPEAFRKDVPDEIRAITRMDKRNIKSQHDPYFMFQDSSGAVARSLNKAVGNDDINIFFKRVDSIIDSSKRESNRLEGEIKQNQEQVDSLSYVKKASETIIFIDKLLSNRKAATKERESIQQTIDAIEKAKNEKARHKEFLKIEPQYDKIKSLLVKINDIKKEKKGLTDLVETLESDIEFKKEAADYLLVATEPYQKLRTLLIEIKEARQERLEITDIVNDINERKTYSQTVKKELIKLNSQYVDMLKEAKICPTCGQSTEEIE